MAKLSREEIINLYKIPNSMTPMEIWKHSDYFTSISHIRKCIQDAINSGEITEEDQEVFQERKREEEHRKQEEKEFLTNIGIRKLLECKSKRQIIEEISQEYGKSISTSKLGEYFNDAITNGILTQEQYDEAINKILEQAAKKRSKNSKQKGQDR